MVIICLQIKRDLETSECFSFLETFPPDLVSAVEGGCIMHQGQSAGSAPARSCKNKSLRAWSWVHLGANQGGRVLSIVSE